MQKPARNVVRAALVLGWWAGIMTAGNGSMVSGLTFAYIVILRVRTRPPPCLAFDRGMAVLMPQ